MFQSFLSSLFEVIFCTECAILASFCYVSVHAGLYTSDCATVRQSFSFGRDGQAVVRTVSSELWELKSASSGLSARMIPSATPWSAPLVIWRTASFGRYWPSAVSHSTHCSKFSSTVRAKTPYRLGAFLFTHLANLEQELANIEHWAMVSFSVPWERSFSTWTFSASDSRSVANFEMIFEQPLFPFAITLHSSRARYKCLMAQRSCHSRFRYFAMVGIWDWWIFQNLLSLARPGDSVSSVPVVPTTPPGRDARVVCCSLFSCSLSLDCNIDMSRPYPAARLLPTRLDSIALLYGWLFRFTVPGSIIRLYAVISPVFIWGLVRKERPGRKRHSRNELGRAALAFMP